MQKRTLRALQSATLFLFAALPHAAWAKVCLVTGGAGFVGSHLCDRLLERGDRVVCLDNLQTGSLQNVEHLLGRTGFSFIRHDVTQPIEWKGALDEIYNLACPASPPHYQADPIQTTKTSVLGMLHVLDLALETGAKVFQASTSEVYGDPLQHPQTESYWGNVNPTGIRACYDEGKRCAETLCFDYMRRHKLDVRVARIFNTYGPRMDRCDGRVVSNFIVQALEHRPLTIYGDGEQTRSFCYISDTVDGIVRLMEADKVAPVPYNLGNPTEFTVKELAQKVLQLTGSHSELRRMPLPQDDPCRRRPDIARIHQAIGWSPKIALDRGLELTVAYFAERWEDTIDDEALTEMVATGLTDEGPLGE